MNRTSVLLSRYYHEACSACFSFQNMCMTVNIWSLLLMWFLMFLVSSGRQYWRKWKLCCHLLTLHVIWLTFSGQQKQMFKAECPGSLNTEAQGGRYLTNVSFFMFSFILVNIYFIFSRTLLKIFFCVPQETKILAFFFLGWWKYFIKKIKWTSKIYIVT